MHVCMLKSQLSKKQGNSIRNWQAKQLEAYLKDYNMLLVWNQISDWWITDLYYLAECPNSKLFSVHRKDFSFLHLRCENLENVVKKWRLSVKCVFFKHTWTSFRPSSTATQSQEEWAVGFFKSGWAEWLPSQTKLEDSKHSSNHDLYYQSCVESAVGLTLKEIF